MELRNTRALVTGASRGLGKSIAEVLARRGADVALVARDAESLNLLAKEIDGKAYPTDLTDPAAVEALLDRVEADGPVDVVVNNAGIDRVGRFPDASAADVRNLLQVNLAAPMELCRQAMPRLVARGRGHIVNVSSYGAIAQGPGVTLYATSKAGLSHFTAGIRAELRGTPVGTTLVQLGEVKTDMIDHIRAYPPARKTIERFERLRMLPSAALEHEEVALAIADAIERNKRHVVMPRQIVAMAKVTEFPRRVSEILLTGIDQNEK
ncbi:short-chain dehydrogenase/reductase SDR [Mycolicibacterium mageritense DSM 44476 = CIP 104973]|uniref:Oxidoreductase n=1 Tax=Mycolicibacterium mageritense TaxID=53462 RepID=A0ABM7I0S9_MYCME|nr:SDR family NAD(P)-dependent oxidoreductase [Mycolicibacterium mageritense]MCC9180016.1 SDR family NAD(P)-dependent oxidoreductase [Mycolicibacterium mageritense]BBX36468.1 oxidoreductase [Mycolicibacterium mageritense]CDO24573.1 short-chain dehydrogenase/reductase SDR [Mycolicibacterium mageritense DSM 44476 = CIP 104973]